MNNILNKIVVLTVLFTSVVLLQNISAKESVKNNISEESLGLRKTDLFSEKTETQSTKAHYYDGYQGSGFKLKRSFQDAPPMIPHDVTGLIPIKINNNQCLGCHMPDVASSVGSTPIPISHFTNFRPLTTILKDGSVAKNGKKIKNTSSETLENVSIKQDKTKLTGARFNCTQCHAPQSQGQLVKNNFEADYTSKNGKNRSNWNGGKLMDGINILHNE